MYQRCVLVALLAAATLQGSIDAGAVTSRKSGAGLTDAAALDIGARVESYGQL
jgi:hypothetical protein